MVSSFEPDNVTNEMSALGGLGTMICECGLIAILGTADAYHSLAGGGCYALPLLDILHS